MSLSYAPSNNRWDNLRPADAQINQLNRKRANRNSKSGVLGVSPVGRKWLARISLDGKAIDIGKFDSVEEERLALAEARRELPW